MSDIDLEALKSKLQSLNESYQKQFAGKNRSQLDPSTMDALLKEANGFKDECAPAIEQGEEGEALAKQSEAFVALCERELSLIKTAKEAGPEFERFAQAGGDANLIFAKYGRHFAGQSRDTRDLGLLNEMVEDLKKIRQRMQAIAGKKPPEAMGRDLQLVTQNIETYQREAKEVANAHSAGTPQEQGDRLANLANGQFAFYANHFAGHSRLTRRPNLLKRVLENLRRIRTQMFNLKNGGLDSDTNKNNLGIVDGRIKAYEAELEEIRKVRKANKLADIMGALGGDANKLFEEYREKYAGKNRKEVSLERIGVMADQLDELYRQMVEMGRVEKNEPNEANQRIVYEYLNSWNSEYEAIRSVLASDS